MDYISTRGHAPALSFEEAMLTGLARDGGLYVPREWPQMSHGEIAALVDKTYEEVAYEVMRPFVGDTFTDDEFRDIIDRAYASFNHAARVPLKQISSNFFMLELFHGPTLAFKDVAMQLIGQMFETVLKRRGERVTIVGATSGDTGSAAIEAFRGLDNVDVFILFPEGRVSEVQRRQMTTPSEANVHALAVDGDFDDCQGLLKDMFADFAFRDHVGLAGVNSINWARIMAQVVYYFYAAVHLGAPHRKISFTVPTGNFGDIYAGYVAKKMGLPIDDLIIATNKNDILHRTLEEGKHEKQGVIPSLSPSMDIQVSSNFERLVFDLYDREGDAVAQLFTELKEQGRFDLSQGALDKLRDEQFYSDRKDDEETLDGIKTTYEDTGEIVCPHSAIAIDVAVSYSDMTPMVALATAHAAKFPDAVEKAIGIRPALPPHMVDLYDREERMTSVPNDRQALQKLILDRRGA
ncbi:threonine synthase [Paracoccaceae bacterium GXU_MW_L88]